METINAGMWDNADFDTRHNWLIERRVIVAHMQAEKVWNYLPDQIRRALTGN